MPRARPIRLPAYSGPDFAQATAGAQGATVAGTDRVRIGLASGLGRSEDSRPRTALRGDRGDGEIGMDG